MSEPRVLYSFSSSLRLQYFQLITSLLLLFPPLAISYHSLPHTHACMYHVDSNYRSSLLLLLLGAAALLLCWANPPTQGADRPRWYPDKVGGSASFLDEGCGVAKTGSAHCDYSELEACLGEFGYLKHALPKSATILPGGTRK